MAEIIVLRHARHIVTDCGVCGVVYTVPEIVYEHHRQEGGYHTCPNGHKWGWEKDGCERERLRLERDRLAQRIAQKDDEIARTNSLRLLAEERADKEARKVRRIQKRVQNGVCPNCNRSFPNLARHMASKHALQCDGPKLSVVA